MILKYSFQSQCRSHKPRIHSIQIGGRGSGENLVRLCVDVPATLQGRDFSDELQRERGDKKKYIYVVKVKKNRRKSSGRGMLRSQAGV